MRSAFKMWMYICDVHPQNIQHRYHVLYILLVQGLSKGVSLLLCFRSDNRNEDIVPMTNFRRFAPLIVSYSFRLLVAIFQRFQVCMYGRQRCLQVYRDVCMYVKDQQDGIVPSSASVVKSLQDPHHNPDQLNAKHWYVLTTVLSGKLSGKT